jgi:LacI family transcriptional regulator
MNSKGRVTLSQIARAAGVSQMAVSMALRNHPRISLATGERIRALAASLGYRPDPMLTQLMGHLRTTRAGGPAPAVAYLVSHTPATVWQDTYHGLMYSGAKARAEALGYKLEVLSLKAPGMSARRMNAILRARGITGMLIAPIMHGGGHLSLDFSRLAVANVGATLWRPQVHCAHHDYFNGTMLMMRNLRRHGYHRIGLVTNQALARTTQHQEEAAFWYYAARLQQAALPILMLQEWNEDTFTQWFRQHRPDAVSTCFLEVPATLRKLGARVPDEVGVALNWLPTGSTATGIQQDFQAHGAAAFDLVEGQLRRHELGVPAQPKTVLVRGRWVEGDTIRPASG